MLRNITYSVTVLLFSLTACTNNSYDNHNNLIGLWKLLEMNIVSDSGTKAFRGGMEGYLLYSKGNHGALHLYPKNYKNFDSTFLNFNISPTERQAKHMAMNYNYMSKYWTIKDTVFHLKLSHSNPTEWGDTSKRIFYFSGDTLILKPIEKKNKNLVLKWLKKN